jgi:carbamate kinase
LRADRLIINTDVDKVMLAWGTDHQAPLRRVTVSEMCARADAGEFAGGSMGREVEAARCYVERTGSAALITSLALLDEALNGTRGTAVGPHWRTVVNSS